MSLEPYNPRSPNFEKVDEDPEYEACKVLSQTYWDGSIPINLLEVCDMYGFEVVFSSMPEMREAGTTQFFGDGDFRIVINTAKFDCIDGFSGDKIQLRRQRFTLAHEIGHCIYKSHTDVDLQKELQDPRNPHGRSYLRKRENQANLFAAHLLVPRSAFQKVLLKIGWSNVFSLFQEISESFNVSMQVTAQQAARLADFPCITILFRNNGMPYKIPACSPDFADTKLFYSKHQKAPKRTLAHQILNGKNSRQHDQRRYGDASTWFPDINDWKADKFSVVETSIQTGQYGVVSFLEVEELDQ